MIQEKNIQSMLSAPSQGKGWDAIIISTPTPAFEDYWETRLLNLRGSLIKQSTLIIAVEEDWLNGAGNGLGALYAFAKAREKGKELYNVDILDLQTRGGSIAIYHAAGMGQRLYPIAGSEYCNKSAVKLPEFITPSEYLTILDGVIRQTAPYASSSAGRLSVFWGDQIFIPSKPLYFTPRHHITILAQIKPLPNEQEWNTQELSKYGLLAIGSKGEAQHVDKSDFKSIQRLINGGKIDISGGTGLSVGSFSLSIQITEAFLKLFEKELEEKRAKFDSDPHFWMPLTLDQGTYVALMENKGTQKEQASTHHKRMQTFKKQFLSKNASSGLFGVLDIGAESFWWDYGTVKNYYENMMKLTHHTPESHAMRKFFGLIIDSNGNTIVNSFYTGGTIKNSVIIGSAGDRLDAENSLIINSVFADLRTRDSFLYNVIEDKPLVTEPGTVRADLRFRGEKLAISTSLGRDGKADWKVKLPGNSLTYEQIYNDFA